jgi:hypothetical protein
VVAKHERVEGHKQEDQRGQDGAEVPAGEMGTRGGTAWSG